MRLGPITEGSSHPLGVTPTATGVNVALPCAGTAVDFCLFDAAGQEHRLRLPARTGEVFHGHVEGAGVGALYGFRAHGPYDPDRGLRFDASKLLLDPYARAIDRPFQLDATMFSGPEPVDSAAAMPKGVVTALPAASPPPRVAPWEDTVVYEAHVRGLTRLHPDVPPEQRGTFAGLAHPAVISHLRDLGVTTLELLPVAAWIDERHLPPLGLTNYWGYNPVAFCAPDPRLAPGGWPEVRAAVDALADAGVETILDVVFNHTGEGDHLGPTLSLRGLDNAGWYRLNPDDPSRYIDDAGTGSALRLETLRGVELAMTAMRTWARLGGVAGFRFDLATVLGRRTNGFDPQAPLLAALEQDPELGRLKLIAEPWDCGMGGYQLGRFPGRWGEWNDRFRDDVRRFWSGADLSLGSLATRLAGSQDAFHAHGRPSRSVNFVTAHDGFTLADLVSYETKHNLANGEQNRDGTTGNHSWNNGTEGPTDDAEVLARRRSDQRALLMTLILSRGTPMLSMGDELGRSQSGNNNAYAQDNEISWLDWASGDRDLLAFVQRLTAIRRAHPAFREDRYLTGEAVAGPLPDVDWRNLSGEPMSAWDWDDPRGPGLQMVLATANQPGRAALIVHRGDGEAEARLPTPQDGFAWRLLASSRIGSAEEDLSGEALPVPPCSVLALAETPARRSSSGPDDTATGRLAEAAGISPEWWSLDGERHPVTPDTQRALLEAMGLPAGSRSDVQDSLWRLRSATRAVLPPCQVAREGHGPVLRVAGPDSWLTLSADGAPPRHLRVVDGEARLPDLPPGDYRLTCGESEGRLIVTPRQAFEPEALKQQARFGISTQLYGLRRSGDQGVGDFATLAQLGVEAGRLGAGMIALNPLHALFPQDRERASPYHPSDRRFIDPLYLDLSTLPGGRGAPADLLQSDRIDYLAVWAWKSAALDKVLTEIETTAWRRDAFEAFCAAGGETLQRFAIFQAISAERGGEPWTAWPAPLQDPDSAETAAFAKAHVAQVQRALRLQWLCDVQLEDAARAAPELGLCRDLAVGAAPDSAEAWAAGSRWAMQASIGAPPDAFAPQGQVWALPPPVPWRMAEDGYGAFRALLAANMRHAGALRVDHALGLSRLFWVPAGADGRDGAYVAYPQDDLIAVLALESQRARCLVIGEDLGTVPDGLRDALRESRIYSYQVLPFERNGDVVRQPSSYKTQAVACVATHDLPPLAGWWSGVDLAERAALELLPTTDGEAPLQTAQDLRRDEKVALLEAMAQSGLEVDRSPDQPLTPELAAAIHAFVAAGPSRIFFVQAEDLAGEEVAINLPGTDRQRPNWRRRMEVDVNDLGSTELSQAILTAVRAARRSAAPSHPASG